MRASISPIILRRTIARTTQPITWLILAAVIAATVLPLTGGGVAEGQDVTVHYRSGTPPKVGTKIEAGHDTDGSRRVSWAWQRSENGNDGWTPIANSGSFAYTPTADDVGEHLRAIFEYTISGPSNGIAEGAAIGPVDGAPTFAPETINNQTYTVDTAIPELNLPDATGGNEPLTYTLTPEVPGLTYDAGNRTLSGTPTSVDTHSMTYTVVDSDSNEEGTDAATLGFTITVQPAPLTFGGATIDDQIYTVNKPIDTLTLPEATGGTGTITHTLPPPFANGLSFDGNTRKITGTPTTVAASTPYTYTATDSATTPVVMTLTFSISVVANQPPIANAGPNQNVQEGDNVTLDGSGSRDPEGETLTYAWSQTDGASVQLNNPTSVNPTFTAPAVNATLTFSLQVADPLSQTSAADTINITVAAVPVCTAATIQQSKAVPSARFDLTFTFAGNCRPEGFTGATFTVLIHADIGVPSGFVKENVYINTTRGSFVPNYLFDSTTEDGDEELDIAGCGQWRPIGASSNSASTKCADVGSLRSIQLRGLTLPSRPASAAEETYDVSIRWDSNPAFAGTIDVGATLEIDGDKLVGFGETIRLEGSGFSDGVTVNLYAQPGTSSVVCAGIGGGGWTNIGSANVGSDHRFVSEVEVSTNVFRSAGKYLVCAVDGGGVDSGTALIIEIKVGLEVVGAGSGIQIQPGQQITLSIEGGGANSGIEAILVAGQVLGPGEWQRSGNNIFVTIPPGRAGTFTVAVTFTGGQTATANITVAAFDLLVQGIGASGIGMGQTAVVSASNLPGDKVCSVTLAGIRLAFLDGDRIDSDGCIALLRGGRLVGNFVMADENGDVTPDLIRRLLDSDGEETLEITAGNGAKASAEVKVGKPAITFDPEDGVVTLRDIITIRGVNFPPDRNYYTPPNISITIDGRRQFVYPTGTSWQTEFEVTNRVVAGSTLRVDVSIGDYPLSELTALYRIKIAPPELGASPATLKVGMPIQISVSGLEAYTSGYYVEIQGGPRLIIGGKGTFNTGRVGEFSGRSMVPMDFHRAEATPSGRSITLKVYRDRTAVPGIFANVTLSQERYIAPQPTPTNTPIPTYTPVPTNTPVPAETPIPPTDTPIPPTNTPVPPTKTPVPPTDTPVPPPTVDRTAIVRTVTAAVAPPDERIVRDRPVTVAPTAEP